MADAFKELPGSRRPIPHGARRIRDLDPHRHIQATVILKAPELPSADKLPDKALTPADFVKQYGASPADIEKVSHVLQSFGLRIENVANSRRSLRVSGTIAAMEAAFRPSLAIYHSAAQGEFRAREGAICIPTELEGLVTGVLGLDQRRTAYRSMARRAATSHRPKSASALTPSDLEQHYDFPPGDSADQRIAIVEFGSPLQGGGMLPPAYFPDDVSAFCKEQKRPLPSVKTEPVGLAPLTSEQYEALNPEEQRDVLDLTSEVMMDIEIIAALCPKAQISVYYAGWGQDGWVNLLDRVMKDRPVVLSISYGLAEDSSDWSKSAIDAINDALQAVAMIGCTVCVSSGDDGSGCNATDTRAHVEFPSCSPFVLAVGGTMISNRSGAEEEVVWWQSPGRRAGDGHSGATGGGVSIHFARPSWQTVQVASLNHGSFDGRVVPDVAALAGPPFYELTMLGQSAPNGGTSAAAPLWASLIARIDAQLPAGKRQRFLPRLLYASTATGHLVGAAACRDITTGNNASHPQPGKGYQATQGFDAVTGWGVPAGKALLAALS
jgi:kumamolisin